jgi:hypothetical protein
MVSFKKWEPNESHIFWAKNLLKTLRDGAKWACPSNGAIYQVYKSKKELHFLHGDEKHEWHYKNILLFEKLSFRVIDKREKNESSSNS